MQAIRAHNFKDRTGERVGRLVVVEISERSQPRRIFWLCQCDCGNHVHVSATGLRPTNTNSCGCLRSETSTARATTHGQRFTPTWQKWRSMKDRCLNPNAEKYADYGGRGITVCQRWIESFENFLADMGECPEGMTLDRYPNNDGNYEPGNCRWATQSEQCRNKRNNKRLTFAGETLTAIEWAERLGMNPHLIYKRLRRGWSDEKILTTQ